MTTPAAGFINPVIVICPPNTSIPIPPPPSHNQPPPDDRVEVHIYYATTTGDETLPLNTPAGNFASQATHVKAWIHMRGDSTLGDPKKQYGVDLKHPEDLSGNFLNMEYGGKHWVFNDTGAVDVTFLRNVLAFELQRQLGQWAPRTKYFELFLVENLPGNSSDPSFYANAVAMVESNPQTYYRGLYINMEKVNAEPNRIPFPAGLELPSEKTFIAQLNPRNSKYDLLDPVGGIPFTGDGQVEIYEPKADYFNNYPTQLAPLQQWYHTETPSPAGWAIHFVNAYAYTHQNQAPPSWEHIQTFTDYPSFAVYFLLNEVARDPDGYHKSTFMYKSPEAPMGKGKMHAGPLWDKNKSFGNTMLNYQPYTSAEGWLYPLLDGGQSPVWWHVLVRDPKFCAELKAYWPLVKNILVPAIANQPSALLIKEHNYLKGTGAAARNNSFYKVTEETYQSQFGQLFTYLTARVNWMEYNLPTLIANQLPPPSGATS